MKDLEQHDREIQANLASWNAKPLLRDVYSGFYERIRLEIDSTLPGEVLEKMGAVDAQKAMTHVPICTVDELASADAVIFGTPTRFGNMW